MNNLVENEENTTPVQDIFLDDPTLQDPDAIETDQDSTLRDLSEVSQRDLISHLLHNIDCCKLAAKVLNPKCFDHKGHRLFAEIAINYVAKYNKLIPLSLMKEEIKERKLEKAESFILAELGAIEYFGAETPEYWCDKIVLLSQKYEIMKSLKKYTEDKDNTKLFAAIDKARDIKQTNTFQLFTPEELEALPALEYLIENHFSRGSTACVFGPSGAGKSFYCLDMALSLATGQDFLEKYKTIQSKVLYINSEGSPNLRGRIAAWKQKAEILSPLENICFSVVSHNLQDRAELDQLVKLATAKLGKIDCVFVDTLSRNFGDGDTDKNCDMQKYLRSLDYLRETTGAAVINVHHTGHGDQDRERGAKSLRDYSDTSICVQAGDNKKVNVSCKKQKDIECFEPYVLQAVGASGSLYLSMIGSKSQVKAVEAQTEAEKQIDELLELIPDLELSVEQTDKNTVTAKAIMEETGWSTGKISKMVNQLIENGQIFKDRFGDHRTPFYYYRRSQIS